MLPLRALDKALKRALDVGACRSLGDRRQLRKELTRVGIKFGEQLDLILLAESLEQLVIFGAVVVGVTQLRPLQGRAAVVGDDQCQNSRGRRWGLYLGSLRVPGGTEERP